MSKVTQHIFTNLHWSAFILYSFSMHLLNCQSRLGCFAVRHVCYAWDNWNETKYNQFSPNESKASFMSCSNTDRQMACLVYYTDTHSSIWQLLHPGFICAMQWTPQGLTDWLRQDSYVSLDTKIGHFRDILSSQVIKCYWNNKIWHNRSRHA